MTLIQLLYYQTVCKCNSFSKASELLHVSQPTISIAISNLEAEFGISLLLRDNRTFTITDAGQACLALANELLALADSMSIQMKSFRNSTSSLRLSVVPFSFSQLLQPLREQFRAEAPEIQIQVFEYTAQEAIQKIKTNSVDLALTIDVLDHPSFIEGLRLFRDPCVFAVGKNHPMAGISSCTFADLAHASLIFTKEDSHLTKQVKNRFQKMGVIPRVILYTAQSALIQSVLQSGCDGAIISRHLGRQLQDVSLIDIEDPVEITHLLIWKQTTHLAPAVSRFIKTVHRFYPEATPYV